MIKFYYRDIKTNKITESDHLREKSWVYVEDPSIKEIKLLTDDIKLGKGYITDALDPYEVPRLEVEENAIYVYSRYPYGDDEKISTAPITLVITDNYMVTISQKPLYFMEPYFKNRKILHSEDVGRMFLQIMTQVASAYNYFLLKISRQIKSITLRVEKINNEDIVKFVGFEEILYDFKPNLVRTSATLDQFTNGKKISAKYGINHEYLDDLSLSVRQLIEIVEDSIQTIRNFREGYTTILTNNLNKVIKLFTSLTVLLTIPTIVASIFGMNVRLPFETNPLAFLIILLLILISTGSMLVFFIKNDYL